MQVCLSPRQKVPYLSYYLQITSTFISIPLFILHSTVPAVGVCWSEGSWQKFLHTVRWQPSDSSTGPPPRSFQKGKPCNSVFHHALHMRAPMTLSPSIWMCCTLRNVYFASREFKCKTDNGNEVLHSSSHFFTGMLQASGLTPNVFVLAFHSCANLVQMLKSWVMCHLVWMWCGNWQNPGRVSSFCLMLIFHDRHKCILEFIWGLVRARRTSLTPLSCHFSQLLC